MNNLFSIVVAATLFNSVLIIINLLKTKTMAEKFNDILAKLDALQTAVTNDEAAESELLAAKNAEIEGLKQQLADAIAQGGLTVAEEAAFAEQINAKIAAIEAEIKSEGVEVPPVEEPETPAEPGDQDEGA